MASTARLEKKYQLDPTLENYNALMSATGLDKQSMVNTYGEPPASKSQVKSSSTTPTTKTVNDIQYTTENGITVPSDWGEYFKVASPSDIATLQKRMDTGTFPRSIKDKFETARIKAQSDIKKEKTDTGLSKLWSEQTGVKTTPITTNEFNSMVEEYKSLAGKGASLNQSDINRMNEIQNSLKSAGVQSNQTTTKAPTIEPKIDVSANQKEVASVIPKAYEYTPSEEMKGVKQSYIDILAKGKDLGEFQAPKFEDKLDLSSVTPEGLTAWEKKLEEYNKLSDTEAQEQVLSRLNMQDPYGGGSSDRARQLGSLVAKQQESRRSQAMSLAEEERQIKNQEEISNFEQKRAEWEKLYGTSYEQFQRKQAEIENAKLKLADIDSFEANSKKYTSETERNDAWNALQKTWNERDIATSQKFSTDTQAKQNEFTKQLTAMGYDQQTAERIASEKYSSLMTEKGYTQAETMGDIEWQRQKEGYKIQGDTAKEIAEISKPREPELWEKLLPAATTVASAFLSPSKTTTPAPKEITPKVTTPKTAGVNGYYGEKYLKS